MRQCLGTAGCEQKQVLEISKQNPQAEIGPTNGWGGKGKVHKGQ